jgi:microcystin-dependent protein
LLQTEIPLHTHAANGYGGLANNASPQTAGWAGSAVKPYAAAPPASAVQMSPNALAVAGSSLPHNNMPPYLALTFIIALQGIFPARN